MRPAAGRNAALSQSLDRRERIILGVHFGGGGDHVAFRGREQRIPDIENQDRARGVGQIPGLVVDRVIEHPGLAGHPFAGGRAHPEAAAGRNDQGHMHRATGVGDADVGRLVERAEPFGLDMGRPHQVALAAPTGRLSHADAVISALERAVVHRFGDRDVLVAGKDGWIVVVAPADTDATAPLGPQTRARKLGDLLLAELDRSRPGRPWRVTVGRPYPGSYGIPRSYEEARDGLAMAMRLRLDTPVIHAEQLLIYRVLVRDQPAITDLVQSVLGSLVNARGGAEPLLTTLDAYFATGSVTTETARRLHLSVRAVTYRLDRVKALTGNDPTDPAQRFTIHAAVLGARLLGWPDHDLTAPR